MYIVVALADREAEKRNQFSFACIFLILDRNWCFFTYIKESISYSSVCLILAGVKNFA